MRQEPKPWYRPVSRSTSSRTAFATLSSGSRLSAPPWGSRRSHKYFAEPGCISEPPPFDRILKEDPHPKPAEKQAASPQPVEEATQAEKVPAEAAQRVVTAKRINHVWDVRSHPGSYPVGLLGLLAPLQLAPVLALRLLGGRGDRPLLPPRHGLCRVREGSRFPGRPLLPGTAPCIRPRSYPSI